MTTTSPNSPNPLALPLWEAMLDAVDAHPGMAVQVLDSPFAQRLPRRSESVHGEDDALRWASTTWVKMPAAKRALALEADVRSALSSPILRPIFQSDPLGALIGWGYHLPSCAVDRLPVAEQGLKDALSPTDDTCEARLIAWWQAAEDLDAAAQRLTTAKVTELEEAACAVPLLLLRCREMCPNPLRQLESLRALLARSILRL